jgi:hypothetical protein
VVEPPDYRRGFRLKARRFRLVTAPHPRRAQMPSRSLPLSVHAGRSRFRGALSTTASLFLPGAFGLAPPLDDDWPRIAVPLTTAPNASSKNRSPPVGGIPLKWPAYGFRQLSLTRNTGGLLSCVGLDRACPHGVRCSPAPGRGAGSSFTCAHKPAWLSNASLVSAALFASAWCAG